MDTSVEAIVGIICTVIAVFSLRIALLLLRTDKGTYDLNRRRSSSLKKVITGRVETRASEFRDYRVQAGLAVDLKNNRWVEQGRISDEAIDSLVFNEKVNG